jgi:hypothetical protein
MKKTKETSSKLSIRWWHNLNSDDKQYYTENYFYSNKLPFRSVLRNDEIEEIWKTHAIDYQLSDSEVVLKQNQKQFKEFNPDLFKAYIDKFSKIDKIKAFKVLMNELNITGTQSFLDVVDEWYQNK